MAAAMVGIETRRERWLRRSRTIPGLGLAALALVALFPLLVVVALGRDALVDRRGPTTRLLCFVGVYLVCEGLGLLASALLWAVCLGGTGRTRAAYVTGHYRLQAAWAGALFSSFRRLLGLRLEIEGADLAGGVPLIVFMRHASVADTLLPSQVLPGWRLRYVLKRELLWDPCLDVVGQRLPNVFVRRAATDSAREIAGVERLADGLGSGEGVLIYPEGTRFTPEKQARRLAAIAASGDPERLARAARLRYVLPPRGGGPLALIRACPNADVLVVGHVGLEGMTTLTDALGGGLIGGRVLVRCWRHPAASVPREGTAVSVWLDEAWARLDEWVQDRLGDSVDDPNAGGASPGASPAAVGATEGVAHHQTLPRG